jgi:hypothetical protein
VSVFENVSLKWKFVGVTALLLVLLTVEGVLGLNGKPSHAVTFGVLVVGFVVGGGLTFLAVRRLTSGVKQVGERIDAVEQAAKNNLMRGLEALAAGDLTVELHASTAATTDFDGDEIGHLMRHTELFRNAIITCYDSYNATADRLRSWSDACPRPRAR